MRLAKYLAHSGLTSRRKAEKLILEGLIKVNGESIREISYPINPERDEITYRDKIVKLEKKVYLLFHKPDNCLCTVADNFDRPIVLDYFREFDVRIYPVGRLDIDTTGILLLTNDGDFAHHMLHPRFELRKHYQALVQGSIKPAAVKQLEKGVELEDGLTAPAQVEVLGRTKETSLIRLSIHQGRKRQIKRMCSYVGHPVINLKRLGYGHLVLGDLKPGEYRHLTQEEVETLLSLAQTEDTLVDKS